MLVRAICLHSRIVKERKASGNLKNGHAQPKCAGFANNSPTTFTVTKAKNRDAYDVTIPFFDSNVKTIDGVVCTAGVRSFILSFGPL